jgi:hypothetical protein
LLNEAIRNEDVWKSGYIDLHFLELHIVGGERSASRPGIFTAWKVAPVSFE